MLNWLRKRGREEDQLEKIVDDIENPADPGLASDEELAPSAKNAVWAVAVAAIVVVIVAAVSILISFRFGRPA